jgi:transposase
VPHEGGGAIPNPITKEGMAMTMVDTSRPVTGGVDTHLEVHVAAALDGIGGLLGVEEFKTTAAGNKALLGWLKAFGTPVRVGVEGTGSYGAGLARYLRRAGVDVVEVDRPNRQERRRRGKTDTVDAIEAARAAQADRQLGHAKTRDGHVETIRALVVAKRSARSSRIQTMNQIRHLGFTGPEEIRQSLPGLSRRTRPRRRPPCGTGPAPTRSCTLPRPRFAPSASVPSPSRRRWTERLSA